MEKKKIFIIEDDINILYGLEAKLGLFGFFVAMDNGDTHIEDLIQKLKGFKPDAIVLDLILPKIDGFALLKAIKSDEELIAKKIIVFTDLSVQDARVRSLNLGANYFFLKEDFNIDLLCKKVNAILK